MRIINKIKELLEVQRFNQMSDDQLENYFIEVYESPNTSRWYNVVEAAHTVGPGAFSILQRVVHDRDTRDLNVDGGAL